MLFCFEFKPNVKKSTSLIECVWYSGVLASDNLESLPWANVPEVAPKEPVVKTPEVVVIIGSPLVLPIAPALVIFP